jgi:tetratricopeptide (TPR) repeat protein
LAEIHLCQGEYASALAETDKAASLGFSAPFFHSFNVLIRGDIYHCQGEFAKAEDEYNKIFDIDYKPHQLVTKRRLAALSLTQGKARKSLELLQKGLEMASQSGDEGQVSDFSRDLAYVFLQTGRREEALRASDVALNNAVDIILREIEALYLKGMALLEMDEMFDVERAANELKSRVESSLAPKYMRYYYHLLGRIEFKKENFVQALENFQKALSLIPYQTHSIGSIPGNQALFYEPLALVYQKMDDSQKARAEFEKILSLTSGRIHYGDIYAKSFYMLGKIYEQQGNTAKAIEHYEKFLDLWKDADPGIAEVDDASERLAGLKGQ